MPIIDCRGERTREQLVQEFEIIPLAHVKLLEGQTKESCAGPTLDREYYVFSYQSHKNQYDSGTFVCGVTAANDFIDLIKQQNPAINRLPLFDPLSGFTQAGTPNSTNRVRGGGGGSAAHQVPNWNPIAKELYDAIGMICIMWNLNNIGGALANILFNLTKNPTQTPNKSDIRSINTIIFKNFKTGNPPTPSLALRFQQFMSTNNNMKNPPLIQFPNLTTHFNQNVANNWNPTPYFN